MEENMNSQKDIIKLIAEELRLNISQVENTVELIDDKNTIPFIARYRKEITGNIDDQVLRVLNDRLTYYRALSEKKEDTKRLIDNQGLLTPELIDAIDLCKTINEIDDIYRPFRPKRKTRATIAIDKGLEKFAIFILKENPDLKRANQEALKYINIEKDVNTAEDVIDGACDIIAEIVSDDANLRKRLRNIMFNCGVINTKAKDKTKVSVYEMYYEYNEPIKRIPGHRILAINRGEKTEFLSVKISYDDDFIISVILEYYKSGNFSGGRIVTSEYSIELADKIIKDSWKRLIEPSITNEIRNTLTDDAHDKALHIFKSNLKNTLMQPPVKDKVVLGFDPAYRTGCKLAIVDKTGKCLATSVIYPTKPQSKIDESMKSLYKLIKEFNVDIIAIGNGTASGESEKFISDFLNQYKLDVTYCMVNEAGASVYSASELGAKEFPEYDVSLRSAVSIARRLQDPLAELVKINPASIGVGQYQHDMNQKKLQSSLSGVVEDCVNTVGVDLNTASPSLLSYIAGITPKLSEAIIEYRNIQGVFKGRKELLNIPKLGNKTFEQCAGFLRIRQSKEWLDNTSVHPESYVAAKKMIKLLNNPETSQIRDIAKGYGIDNLSKQLNIGILTLNDIIDSISKPGLDPRGDGFKTNVSEKPMDISDLKEGMILQGVVRNVSAFGAFVDIGVHQDGLVHISQLSDKFIKDPSEVVSAGQDVKVKVIGIDLPKKRISLSMKDI